MLLILCKFKVEQTATKCYAIYFGSVFKLIENFHFLNSDCLCRVRMKKDINSQVTRTYDKGCKQVRFPASGNLNSKLALKTILIRTKFATTSWNFGEESIKYCKRPPDRKNSVGRPKTTWLRVTLNHKNRHGEVELPATLWSRNSIEKQDKDKLGRLSSETKACERKWLTSCLSGRPTCITYVRVTV